MANMLVAALSAGSTSAGTSVISDAMRPVIVEGFQSLQATVVDVLTISVPVTIGIITLVQGVRFAYKYFKGAVSVAN